MPSRLDDEFYARLDQRLAPVDAALAAAYPGEPGSRQPVHTVYVPADKYHAGLPAAWGRTALDLLDEHVPDPSALAALLDIPTGLAEDVRPLVAAKLVREPIEDLRIDFEDGFGPRSDEDEDAEVRRAGRELAVALAENTAPPFVGIRFKSLEPATRRRGLRTLDLFLDAVSARTALPAGLVVTLPKVTHVGQVEAFLGVCTELERAYGLAGPLRFEIQIETPQSVQDTEGRAPVAAMVQAGRGHVSGLHYGTYDYSAACGVTAGYQSLAHPVADHAKAVMQLAAAGTGVRISDGSTNVLPVGSPAEIRSAWRLHAQLVNRALERAYYQGWDMHPGHLVTRFAATYSFFRTGFPAAAGRLRAYLGSVGTGVLDEPASAQAMAALLVRGVQSGALTEAEVERSAGVDEATLLRLYQRRVG